MRGQASAEFMITLAIMLIVFLVLAGVASSRYDDASAESLKSRADELVKTLGLEINAVYLAGDNAERALVLPRGIDNEDDYSLFVFPANRSIVIVYDGGNRTQSYKTVTGAITGRLSGINGTVFLSNIDGEVTIG